jgi:hypothetical protein
VAVTPEQGAVVQPLSFDFGTDDGLFGPTRPAATVALVLQLVDGSTRRFERLADADGRFRFAPGDIPAREGWSLADVRDIEVVLPVGGGHEIVGEAHLGPAPRRLVFLPFALRAVHTARTATDPATSSAVRHGGCRQ